MKIGLIGFGNLGQALATRLLDCGHEIVAWNRNPDILGKFKVEAAKTPGELVDLVDIICICVFDSKAVTKVLTMPEGILASNVQGKVVVDFTTNHYAEISNFVTICAQNGCEYLESPVLGSVIPALQGMLTLLVAGSKVAYQKVKPLLDNLAKTQFYLPKHGLATRMKLINNMLLGNLVAVIAESVALGERTGIDRATCLDILAAGAGNSALLNAKKAKLVNKDFSPHFSNKAIHKDSILVEELANELGYTTTFGHLNSMLYGKAIDEEMAEEDLASIYTLFARENKVL